MTKANELRELTDDVLADRLVEAKEELWKRRLDHATGQLDNTTGAPEVRARDRAHQHPDPRARDRGARGAGRGP